MAVQDLRRFPRYKVIEEIQYEYEKRKTLCELVNISEGGMLLKLRQIMEPGDEIVVILDRKYSSLETRIKAMITHVNYEKAGISFISIKGDQYMHLKEYMREITLKRKYYLN